MKEEVPVDVVGYEVAAERLEASLAELEREKRVVETLYRVAQAVAREDDLHEIVQVVTDETTEIVGAQFGAFFYNVVGRDGDEYSLYTISGVPRSKFASFPMPRATDIFRPTFEGTAIVRLDDVTVDLRFGRNAPYNGMPPGHLPVRSYLAVPVFIPDGSVVGGLFFGHPEIGVFSAEDEQIAAGISTQAGTAIAKARLLAAERDARAEAEARSHAAIALEYVDDGIAMVDNDGFIRLWNRAAARITGLTDSEVVGRPIGEAVPGWERIALDVPVGDWTSTSRPQTLPLDAHDHELWLSVYGVGFPGGTVYGFRNVTDERELEELRVELVATVSHELRTPVAAVYGAAQTLRRENLPPETVAQLFDMITAESERLTGLVDQILLTSQIDAGTLASGQEAVDPLAVAEAVLQNANVIAGRPVVVLEAPKQVAPVQRRQGASRASAFEPGRERSQVRDAERGLTGPRADRRGAARASARGHRRRPRRPGVGAGSDLREVLSPGPGHERRSPRHRPRPVHLARAGGAHGRPHRHSLTGRRRFYVLVRTSAAAVAQASV